MALVGPRPFAQTTAIQISEGFKHKINQAFKKGLHSQATGMANLSLGAANQGQAEALRVVKGILLNGVTPLTGGMKSISYSSLGKNRRLKTPLPWKPLSERYAHSNPVSEAFWAKHKGMTTYRVGKSKRTTLAAAFSVAALGDTSAKTSPIRNVTGKSKLYYTFTWDILLNTPRSVLSEMISTPFSEGLRGAAYNHSWQYDGSISKRDVSFIVWVEGYRPFVRRMSWKIGKDLRSEITKIMTAKRKVTNVAVAAGAGKLGLLGARGDLGE